MMGCGCDARSCRIDGRRGRQHRDLVQVNVDMDVCRKSGWGYIGRQKV